MADLKKAARLLFDRIAGATMFGNVTLRRNGVQHVQTRVEDGSNGPELYLTAEGLDLRIWTTAEGPGCTIQGAQVLGFMRSRFNREPADRCIGVFIAEPDGISWLAVAKGDLPATGVLDLKEACVRSGPDRLIELTHDLHRAAWAKAVVRDLPEEIPKAILDKLAEIEKQKGGKGA